MHRRRSKQHVVLQALRELVETRSTQYEYMTVCYIMMFCVVYINVMVYWIAYDCISFAVVLNHPSLCNYGRLCESYIVHDMFYNYYFHACISKYAFYIYWDAPYKPFN